MHDLILKFTHANSQKDIYVAKPLIFSCYYSDAHKATHIVANGGAIIPVLDSLDNVVKAWQTNTNNPFNEEKETNK